MDCKTQQQQSTKTTSSNNGTADRNQNSFLSATTKPFYSAQYEQQSFNSWKSSKKFMNNKQRNYKDTTNKQLVSKGPQQQNNYQAFRGNPVCYNGVTEETSWNGGYRNTKPSYVPKSNSLDIRGGRYQSETNFENNNKWYSRKPNQKNRKTTFDGGMGFQKLNNFIFLVDSPDVYGKRTQNNSQSYWCKTKNNYATEGQQNSSEDNQNRGIKGNKNNLNRNRDMLRDDNSYNCSNSNYNQNYSRYRPFNDVNKEESYYKDSNNKSSYGGNNYRKPKEYRPFFNQTNERNREFNENNQKENSRGNAMKNGIIENDSKFQNIANFNNQNGKYTNNFKRGRGNHKNTFGMPKNGFTYSSNNIYTYGVDNYSSYSQNAMFTPPIYRDRSGQPRGKGGQVNRSYNVNYKAGYYKDGPFKNVANKVKSSCPNFKDYENIGNANQNKNVANKDNNVKTSANSRNASYNCRSVSDYGKKAKGNEEQEKTNTSCGLETAKTESNQPAKLSVKTTTTDHSITM